MEKLRKVLRNKKVGDVFFNLYDRWRDESEYEDINEYGKVLCNTIKKEFPEYEISIIGSTKKPFGIKVSIDNRNYHIYAKLEGYYVSLCAKLV